MRITDVEAIPIAIPIGDGSGAAPISLPYADQLASLVFKEYRTTLVRIKTNSGIEGIGECMVRLAPLATAEIVDYLAPLLIGQDPRDTGHLWELMYGTMMNRGHQKGFFIEAVSGIDIALWDILGKSASLPIYRLLGGAYRESIPCYASSLRFREMSETIDKIDEILETGVRAIKVKIGRDAFDPREDMQFLGKVREYLPDDVTMMTDANCGYDIGTAKVVGRVLEGLDVYWFEEPLPPDDYRGYRQLKASLDVRIAGGETHFTRFGFRTILENDALSIIQPNVSRAGGITECMKIAAISSAFGIPYAPHTGSSSSICIAASIQVAAAIPNFLIFEHMVSDWSAGQPNPLRHQLVNEPEVFRDGQLMISEKPGLGVSLNEDIIAKYRIKMRSQ